MKSTAKARARERLDDRLTALKPESRFQPPPKGWIRAIRDALGMSGVQLASRLGVRPQTVEAMEKSEAAGSIQLDTLRRAAEALDCTLVYALAPKKTLEQTVNNRARAIAIKELARIAHTMKLEGQETSDHDLDARVDAYISDVLRERDLWGKM